MRQNCLVLLAVALVLTAGSAWAEEIVHFTNGTTMPIRAHEVRGEMIHVDLGGDSFMAFPASMVEKVEQAGGHVLLDPSANGNKMINDGRASNEGSRPARGTVPSRYQDGDDSDEELARHPNVEQDEERGVAVHRPHAGSGHPARDRGESVATMRHANAQGQYRGTKAMGSRNVIGTPVKPMGPYRSGRGQVVGFGRREPVNPTPPPKTDDSSSSSGSDSGD